MQWLVAFIELRNPQQLANALLLVRVGVGRRRYVLACSVRELELLHFFVATKLLPRLGVILLFILSGGCTFLSSTAQTENRCADSNEQKDRRDNGNGGPQPHVPGIVVGSPRRHGGQSIRRDRRVGPDVL